MEILLVPLVVKFCTFIHILYIVLFLDYHWVLEHNILEILFEIIFYK